MDRNKKILIHIGTPKTGTTSIQSYLRTADLGDITYPALRGINHNILKVVYCFPATSIHRKPRWFWALSEENQQILSSIQQEHFLDVAGNSGDMILSGENMIAYTESGISAFRTDLHNSGYQDCRVVAYLRNPADYYMSRVQQMIKISNTYFSPGEMVDQIYTSLKTWKKYFPGAVHVRPFSESSMPQGNVVLDFVRFANSYFGSSIPEPVGHAKRNTSLSVEELALLQKYRLDTGIDVSCSNHPRHVVLFQTMKRLARNDSVQLNKPSLKHEVRQMIFAMCNDLSDFLKDEFDFEFPDMKDTDGIDTDGSVNTGDITSISDNYDARKHIMLQNLIIDDLLKRLTSPRSKESFTRQASHLMKRLVKKTVNLFR